MIRKTLTATFLALALGATAAAAHDGHDHGPEVKVGRAWARATPGNATTGVAYVTILSMNADKLLHIETPVAAKAEIHTHTHEGDVMKMDALDALELPANKVVELRPDGSHIMLMDLKQPLKEGESFPLTLTFEKAGERKVMVRVDKIGARGPAPVASSEEHHHDHGGDEAASHEHHHDQGSDDMAGHEHHHDHAAGDKPSL